MIRFFDPISERWITPKAPEPPREPNALELMADYMAEERRRVDGERIWEAIVQVASTGGVVLPAVKAVEPDYIREFGGPNSDMGMADTGDVTDSWAGVTWFGVTAPAGD